MGSAERAIRRVRLAGLREERGLTQIQMARLASMSIATYRRLEAGRIAKPLGYLAVCAHVLEVPIADLLEGDERSIPPPASLFSGPEFDVLSRTPLDVRSATTVAWEQAPIGVGIFDVHRSLIWENDAFAAAASEMNRNGGGSPSVGTHRTFERLMDTVERCLRQRLPVGGQRLSAPIGAPTLVQRHWSASYVPLGSGPTAVGVYLSDSTRDVYDATLSAVLQPLLHGLGSALRLEDVISCALPEAAQALQASAVGIGIVDGDGIEIATLGIDTALLERSNSDIVRKNSRTVRIPLERDWPMCDVVRNGSALTFSSLNEAQNRYPDLRIIFEYTPFGGVIMVPITSATGQVIGTFEAYWPTPRKPSSHEQHAVELIARVLGDAIQRVRGNPA